MPRGGGGKRRGFSSLTGVLGDFLNGSVVSNRTGGRGSGQGRHRKARGRCRHHRQYGSGSILTPWVARDAIAPLLSSASANVSGPLVGAQQQVKTPVARVDTERCVGCGVCVEVCPTSSIKVEYGHAVVGEGCIGCGVCVSECPNGALSLG